MNLSYSKMHGTGNDFIIIDLINKNYQIKCLNKLAKKLCERHFGVGGDGLICVLPCDEKNNDFKMRIFNTDGSEAEMCGNGIRCFAHFVKENNLTNKKRLKVETLAGVIKPEILEYNQGKSMVKVNMGKPLFKPQDIPVKIDQEKPSKLDFIEDYPLKIQEKKFNINCVSMGNPHSVIFDEDIENIDIKKWGSKIETHNIFPEKTNVEFIKIIDASEIEMKVWERGSGITLACGTGACASVVAGIKKGLLNKEVTVHLPGGDLNIKWPGNSNNVLMTGPAETVFTGETVI